MIVVSVKCYVKNVSFPLKTISFIIRVKSVFKKKCQLLKCLWTTRIKQYQMINLRSHWNQSTCKMRFGMMNENAAWRFSSIQHYIWKGCTLYWKNIYLITPVLMGFSSVPSVFICNYSRRTQKECYKPLNVYLAASQRSVYFKNDWKKHLTSPAARRILQNSFKNHFKHSTIF